MDPADDWLEPAAAAEHLKLPLYVIYRLIGEGRFPTRSSPLLVCRKDLDEFLQGHRVTPGTLLPPRPGTQPTERPVRPVQR